MIRKISSLIAIVVITGAILIPTQTFADDPIKVFIDGKQLKFEVEPVLQDGSTLVPFRTVFEKIGLKVGWNDNTQTITGTKDGLNIQMKIGDKNVVVNGKTTMLEVAPTLINGITLVPLRFVGESSGGDVTWNQKNKSIYIFFDKNLDLCDAAYYGDIERIEKLIKNGADVNSIVKIFDTISYTPLMKAVSGKSLEAVKKLISLGAKVNQTSNEGWTALFVASLIFDSEEIIFLLEKGADPNILTKDGSTALSIASADVNVGSSGHPEVVKVLLDAGANPNVVEKFGWTPLLHAIAYNQLDTVKVLLDNGANPNLQTINGIDSIVEAKKKLANYLKYSNNTSNSNNTPKVNGVFTVDQAEEIVKDGLAKGLGNDWQSRFTLQNIESPLSEKDWYYTFFVTVKGGPNDGMPALLIKVEMHTGQVTIAEKYF